MYSADGQLYGKFRTNTFTEIFPDVDTFINAFKATVYSGAITDTSLQILYYQLYAAYGNSNIANADENQFKYKVWSIIFNYGPSWEKKLDIQKKLRELTDDEIILGSKEIYNHSFNPSSAPTTSTLDELETINEQNTSNRKRSKLDAYAMLYELIVSDVTMAFIKKFERLFLFIVEPESELLYGPLDN